MKTSPLFFGSHLHACCVSLCILRLSLQRNLMFNKAAAPFYLSPRQESAPVQQAGRACDDCDPIKMCLPACQSWTGLRAALQGRNLWENLKIKHKNNRKHWNWSISWVFISLNPACLCRYIKKMMYRIWTWGTDKKPAILWQNMPGNMSCGGFVLLINLDMKTKRYQHLVILFPFYFGNLILASFKFKIVHLKS